MKKVSARKAFAAQYDHAAQPRNTRYLLIQNNFQFKWFDSRSEAEYFAREHRPEGNKIILTEKQARKEGYIA